MFDEKKALKLLEEDRRNYIKRTIEFAHGFLERGLDEKENALCLRLRPLSIISCAI
jgi:hypothetical protein